MTRFLDGPVRGEALLLRRAPMFLRVVVGPGGKVDALDQLEDVPEAREVVHVYRRVEGTASVVCIRPGGCYHGADYRHVPDAPAGDFRDLEGLRTTAGWRAWVERQP